MVGEDALKMFILHLEGESNDWWFHGLITLGNDHISSYEGLSNSLMERLDRKDHEIPFKELAQLNQGGTPKAYMLEFEKLLVMVFDVSMARLKFTIY